MGLPEDMLSLIKIWLKNWLFYFVIDGQISKVFVINHGTIQGSILGPVLCMQFLFQCSLISQTSQILRMTIMHSHGLQT